MYSYSAEVLVVEKCLGWAAEPPAPHNTYFFRPSGTITIILTPELHKS